MNPKNILVFGILLLASHTYCRLFNFYGRPHFMYFLRSGKMGFFKTKSFVACHQAVCGNTHNCASCFHMYLNRCYKMKTAAQSLLWGCGPDFALPLTQKALCNISMDTYKYITTFSLNGSLTVLIRPKIFWRLDDVMGGLNLGTVGWQLDMEMKSVKYLDNGPRSEIYRTKSACQRGEEFSSTIKLSKNAPLLQLNQPFTIAVWVKTGPFDSFTSAPVMDAYPYNAMSLWFHPSLDRSQLALCHEKKCAYTVRNKSKIMRQWRHIAVTFQSKHGIKFYLEGRSWATEKPLPNDGKPVSNPSMLIFWNTNRGKKRKYYFHGSLACFIIFDRVFSAGNIPQIMNGCP